MTDKNKKIKSILKDNVDYTFQNYTMCFLPGNRLPGNTAGEGFLAKIQDSIKKTGWLYYLLRRIFSPVIMSNKYKQRLNSSLNAYSSESIILNLGSGPQYFQNRKDIINVDVYAFNEVDIVANVSNLPIKDNSVDFILNIAMLEHDSNPEKIIAEAHRVLKPKGKIFAFLPFMQPFHAAPNDFYRWTGAGIKYHFYEYKNIEINIGAGPTSGMLWVVQEWLAIFFSFGNRTIHDVIFVILMVLTAPIKLSDLLFAQYPNAEKIASGFFVIGEK